MNQYEKTSLDAAAHIDNDDNVPRCRVCFEEGTNLNDPLIAPCNCNGGIKWIHRSCLDDWRATKTQQSFTKCEICHFTYELIELQESVNEERTRRFIYYTYVMGHIGLGLVALEAVCALLALILYGLDSKQHSLATYLGATESNDFLGAYVLWAHLALFFLIGCVGLLCALCLGSSGGSNTTYCFWMDCGNNDTNGCSLILLLVMVIVVAAIGLFIGIYIASEYFRQIFQRRREVLWKKQEVKRLIVKDLSLLAMLSV